MKIYLAPMEGLADHYLRDIISEAGGYDLLVSEFVRVVDHKLPIHVFTKQVPELLHKGKTTNQTPIRVQLLGSNPMALAENAVTALSLGSHGIDLNFGCPSKTVNNSKGGAVMLREPESIYRAVKAVTDAIDPIHIVSAKMRLGYEDDSKMMECADAIYQAGAREIVVHARTKQQGYAPPAYWHLVAKITKAIPLTAVINGEIWNADDANKALFDSGCQHVMIGRGAVRNPWLAQQIKKNTLSPTQWSDVKPKIHLFWEKVTSTMPDRYCAGRLKQWLSHLKEIHPEAELLFLSIRKTNDINDINKQLMKL